MQFNVMLNKVMRGLHYKNLLRTELEMERIRREQEPKLRWTCKHKKKGQEHREKSAGAEFSLGLFSVVLHTMLLFCIDMLLLVQLCADSAACEGAAGGVCSNC